VCVEKITQLLSAIISLTIVIIDSDGDDDDGINNNLKMTLSEMGSRYLQLAVWLSGNALDSINVVALRQTRLVLGWVTVFGRVNYFGM